MRKRAETPPYTRGSRGFTLIELLTSIAIIALLGAVAMPGINSAMQTAKMNAAMQNARQVTLGLRGYANDSGGVFPAGRNDSGDAIDSSNAAFRDLEAYIDDESIYAVAGSAWGSEAKNSSPYCDRGEVHWAYIAGLSTTSTSWYPLVVDGTDGSGTYTTEKGERGGIWKGRKAVVAKVDGSATTVRLQGKGDTRYIPRTDEGDQNALEVAAYMGRRAELLDPER